MYKIVENKSKEKISPIYKITFNYMIGDGEGDIEKTCEFSKDVFENNELLQEIIHTLDKFSSVKIPGFWAVGFDGECRHLKSLAKHKIMSEREIEIIASVQYGAGGWTYEEALSEGLSDICPLITKNDYEEYSQYFDYEITGGNEYSYFCFTGINVTYIDEDNITHEVQYYE